MHHQPRRARRSRTDAALRALTDPHGLTTHPGPIHDPQAYLEALRLFWADARDHLDDAHYLQALPLLEQLRAVPEPRDPDHDEHHGDEHPGAPA